MSVNLLTAPPRSLRLGSQQVPVVGRVRMYVCGITPYDVTHLGHAATFIWADAADKVLTWAGNTVSVARNITDVDDVLYAEAARRGQDPTLFGAVQRASFEATMTTLRVRKPDHSPTAAQAIGHVVQLAATLLANGSGYLREGCVYARTPGTAQAAGVSHAQALALAAEYHDDPSDPNKEDPLDVVVWRSQAKAGFAEMSWPSPWGAGRPGWHAECAAMVLALYGSSIDLHCGGADLAFPHHASEAALAQVATGVTPFARAWLRAGLVSVNGEKMSKSTGNLVLVEDLLREHTPAAIRLMCLNRPSNEPWSFTPELLDRAAGTLESIYAAAGRPTGGSSGVVATALLADLDVAAAVDLALVEGGAAARTLVEVLALS